MKIFNLNNPDLKLLDKVSYKFVWLEYLFSYNIGAEYIAKVTFKTDIRYLPTREKHQWFYGFLV